MPSFVTNLFVFDFISNLLIPPPCFLVLKQSICPTTNLLSYTRPNTPHRFPSLFHRLDVINLFLTTQLQYLKETNLSDLFLGISSDEIWHMLSDGFNSWCDDRCIASQVQPGYCGYIWYETKWYGYLRQDLDLIIGFSKSKFLASKETAEAVQVTAFVGCCLFCFAELKVKEKSGRRRSFQAWRRRYSVYCYVLKIKLNSERLEGFSCFQLSAIFSSY